MHHSDHRAQACQVVFIVKLRAITRYRHALGRLFRTSISSRHGVLVSQILDNYVTSAPSHQHAVDIFRGEWSSKLPDSAGAISGGLALHFDDARLAWFLQQYGSVAGESVLELGPMEGGHGYMMEQAGAADVVAIEANTRAFLKCLVVKELLQLQCVHFQLGDFNEHLKGTQRVFDVALASGVLYHMRKPAELIQLLSEHCRTLFIWTHYHDRQRAQADPQLARMLSPEEQHEHYGFKHAVVRKAYGDALGWQGFCGGSAEYAYWMPRDDLMACLSYFGFDVVATGFEQPDHPNGPALALWARNARMAAR